MVCNIEETYVSYHLRPKIFHVFKNCYLAIFVRIRGKAATVMCEQNDCGRNFDYHSISIFIISGTSTPFQVRFVSDSGETVLETIQSGFQLGFIQT